MKLITDHLGQIIAVIAAISLLITSIVFFKGPVGFFFENIIEKETSIGDKVFENLENVGMFEGEGGSGGAGGSGGGAEDEDDSSGEAGDVNNPDGSDNEGDSGDDTNNNENLPVGGEVNITTGEILDTWEVIINNINNGTYDEKYAIGNYKALELGSEGVINMQIAAFDTDVLSDGSGKARVTWIAKELLLTRHVMNDTATNADGWAATKMRSYLANDVWALIPTEVQRAIVAVDKTYYVATTEETRTCSDKVWIPSWREVELGGLREKSGVTYNKLFTDTQSRLKTRNGVNSLWWFRSAQGDEGKHFSLYSPYGYGANPANSLGSVALSFCM